MKVTPDTTETLTERSRQPGETGTATGEDARERAARFAAAYEQECGRWGLPLLPDATGGLR